MDAFLEWAKTPPSWLSVLSLGIAILALLS